MFLFLGYTWQEKVAQVQSKLKEKNAIAFIVTALDEVACELMYTFCVISCHL
jgi:hypothetical protein